MREAQFYTKREEEKVLCNLCPHHCTITADGRGFCKVRHNIKGMLVAESYGKITSMALDPIEKKPLYQFYPGKKILSLGSYGCNFRCGYCQNHGISMDTAPYRIVTPQEITKLSEELKSQGNIGVAYTYNEPLISMEFIMDCAELILEQEQKNVIVTNGYISEEPLKKLLPLIHAMNIDLKSFQSSFYDNISGNISDVKRTIEIAVNQCHVEVTTLIIAGENDTAEEMDQLAGWLSGISKDIPLHISRFFPAHQYKNHDATKVEAIYRLVEVAKRHLKYVYPGNCQI